MSNIQNTILGALWGPGKNAINYEIVCESLIDSHGYASYIFFNFYETFFDCVPLGFGGGGGGAIEQKRL